MARSLKTQMTHTIALMSDSVATSGFEGEMVRACVEASIAAKHMLIIGEFAGDDHFREHLVNGFLDRRVDGFLYASGIAIELEVPEALREQPLVMINCLPRNADVSAVISDDADGAKRAARHIIDLGHRDDIWLVGETPRDKYVAADRRRGFEEALADHSIEIAGSVACNWWPESAFEAVTEMLASGERPRALVCLNDRVAMGAYQALEACGWTIPDDVTIVAFDDSPLASWLQPNLTSVAMPYHAMGVRAVELLLTQNHADGIHRMPMPIHVRGSSAAPRA
jgi:LacI family transcriptional regulator